MFFLKFILRLSKADQHFVKVLKTNFYFFNLVFNISTIFYLFLLFFYILNAKIVFGSIYSYYSILHGFNVYYELPGADLNQYFLAIHYWKEFYLILKFFTYYLFYYVLILIIKLLVNLNIISKINFINYILLIYKIITILFYLFITLSFFTHSPIDCGIIQALLQKLPIVGEGYIVQGIDCYVVHDKLKGLLGSELFENYKYNFINSSQVFDIMKVREFLLQNLELVNNNPKLGRLLTELNILVLK